MTSSSSLYGSTPQSGNISSTNLTTLYSGNNAPVANGNLVVPGTLTVNGCAILTNCSAFSLLPTNAESILFGGAATSMSIGSGTGITTINNQLATANYSFPVNDGVNGQVLVTDGAGTVSFAAVTTVGKTYNIDASTTTGGANLNLTSDIPTTDTVKFAEGTGISIVRTDANTITITNTGLITGVTSITGTTNQVIASSPTGAVTLSLPQDIATTSNPVFAGVTGDNVTVGVVGNNTISTTTGDLVLDSASGTIELDGIVNIKGDYLNLNSDNSPFSSAIRFNSGAAIDYNYAAGQFETTRKLVVDGTVELNNTLTINGLTSGYTSFNVPATGSNLAYTLPGTAGAVNTVLTNDGSGNLSWALPGGGGSTFGNITIAVVDDNTIATTTGNLILGDSANTTNYPVINSAATSPVTIQRFTSTPSINTNVRSLALSVQSTGTPTVGFGNSLEFQVEAQPSNTERAGYISVTSTDLTAGSEDFKMSFGLMENGAAVTEKAYLTSSGALVTDDFITAPYFNSAGVAVYDSSGPFTTSTTTPNQVASTTNASAYRSLKYQYQITSGTEYQAVEIMVIHDGTNAYLNTYSDIRTGANLSTFDADISGGFIRLLVTPTNAVTTYKGAVTAIAV